MTNGLLEEYRTLREEILLHIRLERQILALSGTVFFVGLAFLDQARSSLAPDLWGVLLIGLLTPLFLLYRAELFAIAKIAAYVQICIEPKVEGLEWTGAHIKAMPIHGVHEFPRPGFEVPPHRAIAAYFVALFGTAWSVPFLLGEPPSWTVLGVMSILSIISFANLVSLFRFRSYRARWEKVWQRSLAARTGNSEL